MEPLLPSVAFLYLPHPTPPPPLPIKRQNTIGFVMVYKANIMG